MGGPKARVGVVAGCGTSVNCRLTLTFVVVVVWIGGTRAVLM